MDPDEELATLIADRLIAHGLIDGDRHDEVATQIAAGTATPEDWRFWIEVATSVDTGATGDAQA